MMSPSLSRIMPALLAILPLGAPLSGQADLGPMRDPMLLGQITRFEAGFDQANRLSGVLLIVRRDTVVLHHAFGHSDPTGTTANTLDTPFPVASITKPMTLAVTISLLAEGRLALNDPLSKWLPSFPGADSITVSHLLNHRAGIRHRVADPDRQRARHTVADVAAEAARFPLLFPPGSESSYSTAGYGVLARVLELASGLPYHALLRSRLFEPAGMTRSWDLTDPDPHPAHATNLLPRDGRVVAGVARHLSYLAAGGSAVSTAADLHRLIRALQQGRVPRVAWQSIAPSGEIHWVGASAGYFAWVDVSPRDSTTVIYLGNSFGGAAPALRTALPALLRGESVAPPVIPPRVAAPPPSVLAEYVGEYQVRTSATTPVWLSDGLRLDDNYLVPIGTDRFWQPAISQPVRFVRDSSGTVVALEQGEGTSVARWPKVR